MHMKGNGLRFGMGLAAVASAMMLLGGCSNNKKQSELALQEAAELREANERMDQSLREKDARIADLETRLANSTPAGAPVVTAAPAQTNWQPPAQTFAAPPSDGPSEFTQQSNGDLVATLAGNVLFDSGRATIKDSAKRQLDRIAREIRSQHRGAAIRVEGHTDSDPIRRSKWASNDALSQARADAVKSYLAKAGVPTSKMESIGYGSSKPKSTKAASRRVEVVITK
jgi:outer membrane protein OmpA-like peptidoglycan-associated protein